MLGPMLASIHNLHYYLNLMSEVRAALDAGSFGAFVAQFKADRARGVYIQKMKLKKNEINLANHGMKLHNCNDVFAIFTSTTR
jgi:queuine/archaeosine tRNA-ribosyltransferase